MGTIICIILFWVEFLICIKFLYNSYREKHLICRCQNNFSHVIFVNRSLHAFKIGLQIQNYKMYKTHITHVFQLYNYKILSNNSIQIDKGIRNVHFFLVQIFTHVFTLLLTMKTKCAILQFTILLCSMYHNHINLYVTSWKINEKFSYHHWKNV